MPEGVRYDPIDTPQARDLALHLAALKGGVAIVQGPFRSGFARVGEGGVLLDHKKDEISVDALFEIRAFDGVRELRWLRDGAGGRGVVLCEGAQGPDALTTSFLIWGEFEMRGEDGWIALSSARIGRLWAPWSREGEETPQRLYVTAREYLDAGRDGIVSAVDTRLIEIASEPPQKEERRDG